MGLQERKGFASWLRDQSESIDEAIAERRKEFERTARASGPLLGA
jgi:hypothetical protein